MTRALRAERVEPASGETRSALVLLHGYGANGQDLIGLADTLAPHLPDTLFLSPDAPERCDGAPMGLQWFPIPWIDGSSEEMARDGLRGLPTGEVIARLVHVPGIGRWTAEMYAMFALGHADVFAPADLALQEGVRMLWDLPERPKEKALRGMAEAWSPWRAVAARLLWGYYHHAKQREGVR